VRRYTLIGINASREQAAQPTQELQLSMFAPGERKLRD
jgi:hypothetical protein